MRDEASLRDAVDALIAIEPVFAGVIDRAGYPGPRGHQPGYETLLRTIVGQQVSVASAGAVWRRMEEALGPGCAPGTLAAQDFDTLRACGLSRQKQGYARSLAGLVQSGALDLANLPADDEAAIAELVRIKGIGRWSAEIYLLFAEGRANVWPAGDLAVQVEIGRLFGMSERPSEKAIRTLAEAWQPWRGVAAVLAWHHYNIKVI